MMKHSFAINLGAAIVLLVPAVALQGGDAKSLDESLKQTVAVLDELAGIEKRLAVKDPTVIPDLLRVTEAPVADEVERDRRRDVLRDELNTLQGRLDAQEPAGFLPIARPPTEASDSAAAHAAAAPTRGDELQQPKSARDARTQHEPAAFETHGYVADAGRLVRAYYKQGRFNEALAVLGEKTTDVTANYWKGRCLEKLGKRDEALVAYRAASAVKDGGADATRAQDAVAFLEWQSRFEARRAEVQAP